MINLFGYDFAVSELIAMILSLSLTCFYALKTGGLKKLIKEVSVMISKFKTVQTVEPSKGQTFETTKPIFRLNKSSGELEKTGDVLDLQEMINSCLDQALSRVLDRLMPQVEEDKQLYEYRQMSDDIDELVKMQEVADYYREKYQLDGKMSMEEVFSVVYDKAQAIHDKLYKKVSAEQNGGKDDEKKTDEESK